MLGDLHKYVQYLQVVAVSNENIFEKLMYVCKIASLGELLIYYFK